MGNKHIVEELIEANKNISKIIDQGQEEDSILSKRSDWIESLNQIIQKLDHIVERLEKDGK